MSTRSEQNDIDADDEKEKSEKVGIREVVTMGIDKTATNNMSKLREMSKMHCKDITIKTNDCSYLMNPREYQQRVYNKSTQLLCDDDVKNNDDDNTKRRISAKECRLKTCQHLQRMVMILSKYHGFVQRNADSQNEEKQGDINLDGTLIVNNFHHLLQVHYDKFEEINNILVKQCSNGETCMLSKCLMMKRNNRERQRLGVHDGELKQMYFNVDNVSDVVAQQILDTVHCHYYHSFDIGYKLSKQQKVEIQQMAQSDEAKQDELDEYDNIIHDKVASSIYKVINKNENKHHFDIKSQKFLSSLDDAELRYSFGIKFFYWDYYKSSTDEDDICLINVYNLSSLQQTGNKGYRVSDFFVSAIRPNLKSELINNEICSISTSQWNIYMQKAIKYRNGDHFKSKQCCKKGQYADSHGFGFDPQKYYNIKEESPITVEHIIAITIHCDETKLQRKFGETYRRIPQNESNQSVIKRHSNYAHLGRVLVELVNCFGSKDRKALLYHGTTIQSQFSSIDAYIRGPFSTSTDYTVAVNFSSNKGMILELWLNRHKNGIGLFDCQYVTDFPNEQEIFFIGGARSFSFLSIIITSSGLNYCLHIRAIQKIIKFLYRANQSEQEGGGMDVIIDTDDGTIKQIAYRIMLDALHRHYPDNNDYVEFKSMPSYIQKLVDYQFNNITSIVISQRIAEHYYSELFYCLFFYDDGWVKLEIMLTMFPSVIDIALLDEKANDKFAFDGSTYKSILLFLGNAPHSKVQRIIIHLNKDLKTKAMESVTPFKSKFSKLNWKIYWDVEEIVMEINTS